MRQIEYLLKLLENNRKILKILNPNLSIEVLEELIVHLKPVRNFTIDEIVIKSKSEGMNRGKPIKHNISLEGVRDCYSKLLSNNILSDVEEKMIAEFETKHPRFRMLINGGDDILYAAVSKNEQANISIDELKLILNLRFNIDLLRRRKTKLDLCNELLKCIYQSSHFDSLKENYTK